MEGIDVLHGCSGGTNVPRIRKGATVDIKERGERARRHFLEGYNCCQAVLLAFSDVFEADPELLKVAASGFGGGLARMREVCGTVSALGMAAGFISPADDPSVKAARTANYALVQRMAAEFRAENGSIICRELLAMRASGAAEADPSGLRPLRMTGLAPGVTPYRHPEAEGEGSAGSTGASAATETDPSLTLRMTELAPGMTESPEPSDRTPEYYRSRPCPELVASAARIIARHLAAMLSIR